MGPLWWQRPPPRGICGVISYANEPNIAPVTNYFWLPVTEYAFWLFKVVQGHRLVQVVHKSKVFIWFHIESVVTQVLHVYLAPLTRSAKTVEKVRAPYSI